MENSYQLQIPSMSGFDMRYYFDCSTEPDEARIFPPHVHDRLEFYALVAGNVSFMVENQLYRLQPGDVIVSKPNEIHNCILNTDSVHQHLCFWFEATSDFLFSDFLTHEMGESNLISPTKSDKARLLTLYHEIRRAGEEDQKHDGDGDERNHPQQCACQCLGFRCGNARKASVQNRDGEECRCDKNQCGDEDDGVENPSFHILLASKR